MTAEKGALPGLTRRRFLVATGWAAAGSTVVFSSGCVLLPTFPTVRDDPGDYADSWIQMLPDNRVRFFMGKAEMGQGVLTGLSQIVAEELNVPLQAIAVSLPTTTQIPPTAMTVGSMTIERLYLPLREASARLRETLRKMAAQASGVPERQLEEVPGGFRHGESGRFLAYGELVKGKPALTALAATPALKSPQSLRVVGQRATRLDLYEKVTGKARFSHDIFLPGMLYGKVARPPAFGALLESVAAGKARRRKGVVAVVARPEENFVGVVAETEDAAREALGSIEMRWKIPRLWQQADIDRMIELEKLKSDGVSPHSVASRGDVEEGEQAGRLKLDRSYATPFGTHVPMETHAGVADVTGERAHLWVSSQDAFYQQARTAEITGLPREKVHVHPTLLGGGFGGKVGVEAAYEAARLSSAVKRPVQVVWSREECFQHGYFRTPTNHRIRAGVTAEGRISFWKHEFASGPVIFNPAMIDSQALKWVLSFIPDFGGTRGAKIPYDIPNQEILHWNRPLPVPTGAWRGLGASTNGFAIESAMDELAGLAGADPLDFRLSHLSGEQSRLKGVLRAVAEKAGWGNPRREGIGRGLACGAYLDKTFVAVVAEVSLDEKAGRIVLERLVCAHDCGLVINPDTVEAQIEGNLVWGWGMALKENLFLKDGRMNAGNFHQYSLPRCDETPEVEIVLVEDKDIPPTGVGEPAIMPTPAAIANAVADASGKRLTRLPIRPENLFS